MVDEEDSFANRLPAGRKGDRRDRREPRGGNRRRDSGGRNSRGPDSRGRRRDGDDRRGRDERWPDGDPADNPILRERGWGGVARRGTRQFEERWDEGDERTPDPHEKQREPLDPEVARQRAERAAARQAARERLEDEARRAIERGGLPQKPSKRVPKAHHRVALPARPRLEDLDVALMRIFGERRGPRMRKRVIDASRAFEEDRHIDALTVLKPVRDGAPEVPEVRELAGLILYRLGRWTQAAKELEAFRALAGSAEQNPVLCDCYRALGRWNDVDGLWAELREVSPHAELVAEGRIVVAGGLADRGRVQDAVRLLEKAWNQPRQPKPHHLRTAYALADLYERSGDAPRARSIFGWLVRHDDEFADAADRLRQLG